MKLKHQFLRYSLVTAAVASTLFSLPVAAAAFSSYDVNLVGSASVLGNGDLQLTNDFGQAGAAWVTSPLSTANSFSATFSFSLQTLNFIPMADGVALVLQNQGTNNVVGSGGGDIGYTGLNGVGSIIQTWDNNKTGLNTDGNASNTKSAPTNLGAANLVMGTETVTYNALTHVLAMNGTLNVDGTLYSVSDNANIDLISQFGPSMYIGFTGGTGLSEADQRITSFNVAPVPIPAAIWLFGSALTGLVTLGRRKSR